jgi:hypothetical protein
LVEASRRLSHRARLDLHLRLGETLGEAPRPPTRQEQLAQRQREALLAIDAVAKEAKLSVGRAPTRTEFARYAEKLGLPWKVSAIGRTFGSWKNAQRAYVGATPESARLLRQRDVLSHGGRGRADHLAIVRRWVEEHPTANTMKEYKRWRDRINDARSADEPPLPSFQQITRNFPGLSVGDLREAALGTVDEAVTICRVQAERQLRDKPNPLQIVGTTATAALLELTWTAVRNARTDPPFGFPVAVLTLGKKVGYYAEDVLAYRDGTPTRPRREGGLNGRVIGIDEMSELCGIKPRNARDSIQRQARHLAPPPDGRLSTSDYWLRESVERWLADKPTRNQ